MYRVTQMNRHLVFAVQTDLRQLRRQQFDHRSVGDVFGHRAALVATTGAVDASSRSSRVKMR